MNCVIVVSVRPLTVYTHKRLSVCITLVNNYGFKDYFD